MRQGIASIEAVCLLAWALLAVLQALFVPSLGGVLVVGAVQFVLGLVIVGIALVFDSSLSASSIGDPEAFSSSVFAQGLIWAGPVVLVVLGVLRVVLS